VTTHEEKVVRGAGTVMKLCRYESWVVEDKKFIKIFSQNWTNKMHNNVIICTYCDKMTCQDFVSK